MVKKPSAQLTGSTPGEMPVTGIGSMPHTDPAQALDLVFRCCPSMPHWPQLPRRSPAEGFVSQFVKPLFTSGLVSVVGDRSVFDTRSATFPERLAAFYVEHLGVDEKRARPGRKRSPFQLAEDSAAGFYELIRRTRRAKGAAAPCLKGQLAGPVTLGLQLFDGEGAYAVYDPQLRDVLTRTLAMHAAWQTGALVKRAGKVVMFIDEPGIGAYGRSTHLGLTRSMVRDGIEEVARAVHDAGGTVGVHSCDTTDWSMLLESSVDILSYDAYTYTGTLLPYAAELSAFLARGGTVAWGIVPTSEQVRVETPESLASRLDREVTELGNKIGSTDRLKRQSLLTPSCGTGLLSLEDAQRVYELLSQLPRVLAWDR